MNCPARLDGRHALACTLTDPHPGYGHRYESTPADPKHDDQEVGR